MFVDSLQKELILAPAVLFASPSYRFRAGFTAATPIDFLGEVK